MSRLPRILITLTSLALVLWLVVRDLEKTNPGPVSAVHAGITDLLGDLDCNACHGDGSDRNSMMEACLKCHGAIAEQRRLGSGIHGQLETPLADACATCHSDHHGEEFQINGDLAFRLAGFEGRTGFDHSTMVEPLEGKHRELACIDCHAFSDHPVLPEDEQRFLGLRADCASCHEDTHEGAMGDDCASCHGQASPFEEVASFDHLAGFPLRDVHGGLACTACHEPEGPYSIPAEQQHPQDIRDCIACHETPHLAGFSPDQDDCIACHGFDQGAFLTARDRFDAEQHASCGFLLTTPHEDLDCASCHDPALDDYRLRFPGRTSESCASCHVDPHQGQFLAAGASATDCLACHRADAFLPSLFDLQRHEDTGFPLDGSHRQADCTDCHKGQAGPGGDPFLVYRDTTTTCADCHADPHDGTFAATAVRLQVDQDCRSCHGTSAFSPTSEPFDHALWTGFPLEEAHASADCSICHAPLSTPTEQGRNFARVQHLFPTFSNCADCHEDPHDGRFTLTGPASEDSCAGCHNQTDFADLDLGAFDHGTWAGFPLRGAHAQTACVTCHGELPAGSGPEGRLGAATDVFPRLGSAADPNRCDACHDDPHGSNFRPPRVPATLHGETSCARCHGETSFRIQDRSFDHDRFTLFPLEGSHASLACNACHAPQPRTRSTGRSFAEAFGRDCRDCHADPHAGQFRGHKDCADCHGSDGTFLSGLDFDHDLDTRFALDQAHVDLDCAACHREYPMPNGGSVTRYRPLGTTCTDCHGF